MHINQIQLHHQHHNSLAFWLCQVTEFTTPKASSSSQCWGWNKQSWHRRPSSSYHPKRYSTMQTSWPKWNFRVEVYTFIIESYERFSTLGCNTMACWGMSMTNSLMTITVWKWYLSHWKLWFSTWDSCCNHGQQLWQLNPPPPFPRGIRCREGKLTSHENQKRTAKHRPTASKFISMEVTSSSLASKPPFSVLATLLA